MMLHGVASVSKGSCHNILSQGPGNAITIVVGGAAESLSAHPGTADLTLKKRFGFIKMAIRAGADLVPVFSFALGVSSPLIKHNVKRTIDPRSEH